MGCSNAPHNSHTHMYYSIIWLDKDENFKRKVKTTLDAKSLIAWGKETLSNFSGDMINCSHEPTKHESLEQPGLFYWAQPNEIGTVSSYVVIAQVTGYPATEAHDDWFGNYEDADHIAYLLSINADIYA